MAIKVGINGFGRIGRMVFRAVYNEFKDDQRLTMWAICTEPTTSMSHDQVDRLMRNWSVQMPVARDLDAHGRDVFKIDKAPTLVIVGSDDLSPFSLGLGTGLSTTPPLSPGPPPPGWRRSASASAEVEASSLG